ncbi:hypothetical protein PAPYR_7961 [Paratrimastix pyriformis]|uniref:Uncharacterized protein n=1 Tax=Paratrimastix pyriformis TaxID=342808 RepID=A0ABQ8UBS7_9EUKA|nr:hypothetical protein PAPYR_7961 [Paratrimastix pyriformis]
MHTAENYPISLTCEELTTGFLLPMLSTFPEAVEIINKIISLPPKWIASLHPDRKTLPFVQRPNLTWKSFHLFGFKIRPESSCPFDDTSRAGDSALPDKTQRATIIEEDSDSPARQKRTRASKIPPGSKVFSSLRSHGDVNFSFSDYFRRLTGILRREDAATRLQQLGFSVQHHRKNALSFKTGAGYFQAATCDLEALPAALSQAEV